MKPPYTSVTMKKKLTASWDKYFLMILKNKHDKCIQMHYIGKSYVITVYKCDNRLKRAVIRDYMGQIFSDEAQKSVTSVYNALYREKLCNHCIQV